MFSNLVFLKISEFFLKIGSFCPSFLAARFNFSCQYTWEFPPSKLELKLHQFPVAEPTPFAQNVSELVFGVNIIDLDLGFQIDSVKQPIKSNSVSS